MRKIDYSKALPRDKDGRPVDVAFAIPSESPKSPFREGTPVYDPEEDIAYQCVKDLDPLSGWATTDFWQKRWNVDHRAIVAFVMAGELDAAVEIGSQVRRYRCRSEYTLLRSELMKKSKHRLAQKRFKDRKAGKIPPKKKPWYA